MDKNKVIAQLLFSGKYDNLSAKEFRDFVETLVGDFEETEEE